MLKFILGILVIKLAAGQSVNDLPCLCLYKIFLDDGVGSYYVASYNNTVIECSGYEETLCTFNDRVQNPCDEEQISNNIRGEIVPCKPMDNNFLALTCKDAWNRQQTVYYANPADSYDSITTQRLTAKICG